MFPGFYFLQGLFIDANLNELQRFMPRLGLFLILSLYSRWTIDKGLGAYRPTRDALTLIHFLFIQLMS